MTHTQSEQLPSRGGLKFPKRDLEELFDVESCVLGRVCLCYSLLPVFNRCSEGRLQATDSPYNWDRILHFGS